MTQTRISWLEHDVSVLELSPFEALQTSTTLVARRPSDEPWLALVKPTSKDVHIYSLSLSLDAYHLFSSEVVAGFSDTAQSLVRRCTQQEVSDITSQEQEKGNPGNLWLANDGLLRIVVPSRLVEQAKSDIEKLFKETEDVVFSVPFE